MWTLARRCAFRSPCVPHSSPGRTARTWSLAYTTCGKRIGTVSKPSRTRFILRFKASAKNLRSGIGFQNEMNLLLASLRRVEIRIEPESITDFLKWKNRMAEYNRGRLPEGLVAEEEEANGFLLGTAGD